MDACNTGMLFDGVQHTLVNVSSFASPLPATTHCSSAACCLLGVLACVAQGVLQHIPACYPGLLMRAELQYLHNTCDMPHRSVPVLFLRGKA